MLTRVDFCRFLGFPMFSGLHTNSPSPGLLRARAQVKFLREHFLIIPLCPLYVATLREVLLAYRKLELVLRVMKEWGSNIPEGGRLNCHGSYALTVWIDLDLGAPNIMEGQAVPTAVVCIAFGFRDVSLDELRAQWDPERGLREAPGVAAWAKNPNKPAYLKECLDRALYRDYAFIIFKDAMGVLQ